MHILYLVPHVPNPTKVVSHFQIRGLREAGHTVTVVTLERSAADADHIARLRQSGLDVIAARLPRWRSALNCLIALPTRQPLQMAFMWSRELMAKINNQIKTNPPDVIHVEHLRMAQYGLRLAGKKPMLWDAVDYLSLLYQDASVSSASLALRLASKLETPRLAAYEQHLTGQFPVTIVIAQRDQELFQQENPYAERVKIIPLGLPIAPLPPDSARSDRTLIITGTLNYHPNVASVHYFVRDIFPLLQQARPELHLQLVGANPPPSIQAFRSDFIEVTGFVPSITEYLGRATIALAPVLYGSGMQIKVLEAFLSATPLVATRVALRGLDVRHEEHVLIADTPADFANAVMRLLDDAELRARIGQAGRRYIEQHHDLAKTTQQLVSVYEEVIENFR